MTLGHSLVEFARAANRRAKAFHTPILLIAALAFATGCVLSFRELDISLADLNYAPLLLLVLVIVPLSIAYSAVNMVLMARAAKLELDFALGVRVSVFAQVAEMLPIPGGMIVRTAALMKVGGGAMQSTGLVLAFALLWIACAVAGAGLALADHGAPAFAVAGAGGLAVLGIHGWLAYHYGHRVALAATGLRIAGLCLVALRLLAAFAAIGVAMPFIDSFCFAFAAIAGGAASIVPAGLGVSEGLSALLAHLTDVDPASAFLAAALSRLAGLLINMLLAAGIAVRDKLGARTVAHA